MSSGTKKLVPQLIFAELKWVALFRKQRRGYFFVLKGVWNV
jgi:hypothetical protein